eukprot:1185288-Prorocentrum_minimum.AAC.1
MVRMPFEISIRECPKRSNISSHTFRVLIFLSVRDIPATKPDDLPSGDCYLSTYGNNDSMGCHSSCRNLELKKDSTQGFAKPVRALRKWLDGDTYLESPSRSPSRALVPGCPVKKSGKPDKPSIFFRSIEPGAISEYNFPVVRDRLLETWTREEGKSRNRIFEVIKLK